MVWLPPRSTRPAPLFPYTTLFRSGRRNGWPCRLGGSIRRGISPMKHPLAAALAVAMAIAAPAYAQDAAMPDKAATASAAAPFAAASPLPLHYPQFAKISDSDFAPAFDRGMAEELAEVKAIAENPAAPTVANTIPPPETSGPALGRPPPPLKIAR